VGVSVLRARPRVRRAWTVVDVSFALVCVVIALFALSSTITLGTRILFEYDPGWWGPLTTLRASGRFVWPLYYALVFGVVAIVVRRLPHGTAVAVLAVGVFLQAADLWGPIAAVRTARALAAWDPLPSPFWARVLPHYAHLVLNPTNMCSPAGSGFDYRYFALKAGSARVTINAGYAARHDVAALDAYCQALARETAERRVQEDTLYVVADQLVPVMQSAEVPVACARIDGVAVCFSTASHARWGDSFDVRHDPLPPDEEVLRFRDRLEAEYRDRMGRPPQPHRGTMSRRTQALARYAALRINGCSDDEAAARVADPGTLATDVGLCPRQAVDALALPPAEAVRHQRARLDTEWASRDVPLETSAVDAEGEAVWLHAYFDLRRRGQTPEQATAEILATIRRIAP
jgi:hypothetical protein